jgi:selenocysteine lyase/cysteine desulfurase
MTPRTRLVALTHASNVLGTVQPASEIGRIVRARDALFVLDAAQTAGVVALDVQAACVDLLAFPGHKSLLGPTGTGALYVGPRVRPRPWREGGTGGDSSTPTQPKEFPYYLEGGTPNVLGIAGLVAGLDFVEERSVDAIRHHEVQLCDRLRTALAELSGFEVFGHDDPTRRVGTLSFRAEAIPAADLGAILDQSFDIAVRPGLHCSPYIHRALGSYPDGLVRVSPGPFNTVADIDRLTEALREVTGGF